jgi:hypothetical protein
MKRTFPTWSPNPGPIANWIGIIFGVVGTLVTIATSIAATNGGLKSGQLALLIGFIVLLYAGLLAYVIKLFSGDINAIRSDLDRAKGAQRSGMLILEVAHTLNDGIAELRTPPTPREVLRFMKTACGDMARSFSDALGTECRVCVKEIRDGDHDRPRVRAVVRSNRAVGSEESESHYIDENTDFDELYKQGKKFWFSNDVDDFPAYINSSPNRKYRSTIVWPILTRSIDNLGGEPFAPIAAFLCVDSDPPGVFDEQIHIPLGWSVADAIARALETRYLRSEIADKNAIIESMNKRGESA